MSPKSSFEESSSSRHNDTGRRGPNVIILSAAGKPIFVRYGNGNDPGEGDANEEEWATACGILQGLRANILSFGLSGLEERGASSLGDLQSIRAGNRSMVFKHTEALTLVSISDRPDGHHNEAWLRLQLEYVYSQVIFTLTSQVQTIFQKSPGYDLRSMMGPNVNDSIRNLLDRFDPVDLDEVGGDGGGFGSPGRQLSSVSSSSGSNQRSNTIAGSCGCFLTSGVECINPIPPEIRENASRMLIQACGKKKGRKGKGGDNNVLFAMLVVGTRLVTIVQPSDPSSQLHTSDMHLILTFVGRQPGLLTNELWFPICLPRFDSSGFLYAYSSCLDPYTGLSIIMISPDNSPEQFEAFRSAANTVRTTKLGLPSVRTKVLRVFDSSSNASATSSVGTPLADNRFHPHRNNSAGDLSDLHSTMSGMSSQSGDSERRRTHLDDAAWKKREEEEYFDEDKEEEGRGIAKRISSAGRRPMGERQLSATCYLEDCMEDEEDEEKVEAANNEAPLLTALKVALSPKQQDEMMTSYLELASAVHFVFRCDIFVSSGEPAGGGGISSTGAMLTQSFGPPLSFPFTDTSSQNHVWDVYQRLSLRLRLGSSSVETTMDALDVIADTQQRSHNNVDSDCPMQCLYSEPPNVHSVTYLQENNEWLFVGLNGKFFECYATLPATISPKTGTAYCARLVRRLMGDERNLFLSNPLTWGSL